MGKTTNYDDFEDQDQIIKKRDIEDQDHDLEDQC